MEGDDLNMDCSVKGALDWDWKKRGVVEMATLPKNGILLIVRLVMIHLIF